MSQKRNRIQTNVSLGKGTRAAIEEAADEFSISMSRLLDQIAAGYLMLDEEEQHNPDKVDYGTASETLRAAIPDTTIRVAEKEKRDREMRERQKEREKKHSYEDRILGCYRKRIEGDAAHRPEGMRDLAKGYREDARIWFDDEEKAEEMAALNDKWLKWYDAGYWARQHADDVETEVNSVDVSGWFEVGRDIYRLREHLDDVVDHVREVADGTAGWDSDAVIDSVASEWSVSRGAAHLLIESLTVEESSIQEALSIGGERLRPTEELALEGDGPVQDRELAEPDVEADGDGDDDDPDAPDVIDVEPNAVEELPDDAIVRKGGRAEPDVVDVEETEADADAETVETATAGDDESGREETAEPDVPDGGLTAADLTTEELIETAVDMVEAGEGEDAIVRALRPDAPSETAVDCAIEVARDRAGTPGSEGRDDAPAALTDGGEL